MAFSPDGTRVATASEDFTARVWSIEGNREPHVLRGHKGVVSQVVFSPDGRRLATASEDGSARVWELDGEKEPVILSGTSAAVAGVAFSPDGGRVATLSSDGTTQLWSLDAVGTAVRLRDIDESQGPSFLRGKVSFTSDGRELITWIEDRLLVWPVSTELLIDTACRRLSRRRIGPYPTDLGLPADFGAQPTCTESAR